MEMVGSKLAARRSVLGELTSALDAHHTNQAVLGLANG